MSPLFYVIGASGSGKDSLLRYARERLAGEPVLFAHRYITRPVDSAGENHIALSETEFKLRRDAGLFSLHWQSHGLYYAIGCEIDTWMKNGLAVVMNGSRAYLSVALARYPGLHCFWIDASPQRLAQRLRQRRRESSEQITLRLARAQQFSPPVLDNLTVINNDHSLQTAGEAFIERLRSVYEHIR